MTFWQFERKWQLARDTLKYVTSKNDVTVKIFTLEQENAVFTTLTAIAKFVS